MSETEVDLASLFESVAKTLKSNQSALNKADAYNHDHGDNMVKNFRVITRALKKRQAAVPSEQLAYASDALRKSSITGSARMYAQGLSTAATRLQGEKAVTAENAFVLIQSLMGGTGVAGEKDGASKLQQKGQTDLLGSLMGSMLGGASSTGGTGGSGAAQPYQQAGQQGDLLGSLMGSLMDSTGITGGTGVTGGTGPAPASQPESPQGDLLSSLMGSLMGGTGGAGGNESAPAAQQESQQPDLLGSLMGSLMGGTGGTGGPGSEPAPAPPQDNQQGDLLGSLMGSLMGGTGGTGGTGLNGSGSSPQLEGHQDDLLGSLMGQLLGGGQIQTQMSQTSSQSSNSGFDINDLLRIVMAYLQAKQQGAAPMQAVIQALMSGSQMNNTPHHSQSGQLVASSLLDTLGSMMK